MSPAPSAPTRSRAPAGAPILWILLLALALAAVLAYQAVDAARSHQRTTEAALRDYATFASWELGRNLVGTVGSTLSAAMLRGRMAVGLEGEGTAAALPHFSAAVERGLRECECREAVHDFFVLDLARGTATLAAERLSPSDREWMERHLLPRLRDSAADLRHSQEVLSVGPEREGPRVIGGAIVEERKLLPSTSGPPTRRERQLIVGPVTPFASVELPGRPGYTLVYGLSADAEGGLTHAFGFALDVSTFTAPLLRSIVSGSPLLPPSLLDRATNEEVLSLVVHSPTGDTLYRSAGAQPGSGEVVDTVALGIGDLVIRAAVRPEMAGRLVIGGLPRSRLPLLLGVFALTLGLLTVAIRQFARQQELIRLRSDFISGVSHELRTPLAQIRLFSDLLDSGRLHETQRQRSVRIIGEEARRLTFLVENILQFSRSERRLGRVSPEPADVAPLVREIVDSFAPLARARRVTLQTALDDGVMALVDADALRQVLLNLLDNAVKYGPPEQRVLVGVEAAGEWVRIRVDDEGPGIPAEERARIWEPYRRLPRDVESATGGSGIGLAVVKELVELHGGRAAVADAPAGGARLVVELPRVRERGAPGEEDREIETSDASGANG